MTIQVVFSSSRKMVPIKIIARSGIWDISSREIVVVIKINTSLVNIAY